MKIVAYTQYGVFESFERDYDEKLFKYMEKQLEQLDECKTFFFELKDNSMIYFSKESLSNTIFVLKK
jgi:hypothetical protein